MKLFILRIFILICLFNSAMSLNAQSVTVQYPNGFEDLMVGSRHGIIWNYSGFNTIRIELSTNNGGSWSTIAGANNLPNTQSYFNWLIPNQISGQCRIRVVDNGNSTINDISNNTFSISAQPVINPDKYLGGPIDGYDHSKFNHTPVTVNYPNGGDVFVVGTRQYITWTYNSLNLVDVEYSLDNGSTWTNISTVSAIQGYVIWNVPYIQSNTCLIRVIDIFNSVNVDQSDQIFSVIGIPVINQAKHSGGPRDGYHSDLNVNPLKVTAPNGGETFVAGSVMQVTWSYASLNNVNIFLSTNNGSNWTSLASNIPATNGTINYTIPVTQTASTQCLVRVDDVVNTGIKDTSDATFTIQSSAKTFGGAYDGYSFGSSVQLLTLVYPNGGDTIYSGSRVSIVWTYQSMNLVQTAFSTDNGSNWTNIGSPVMATQQMINWLVPVTPSTQCLVRVFDVANPSLFDESNTVFTIPAAPVIDAAKYSGGTLDGYHFDGQRIDLLTPDGGDVYYGSTPMDIHWRYYNSRNTSPPNVAIELSTNSGLTWATTVTGSILSTTGFFRYTVPAINTTQARIRVRDLSNGIISDSSHTDFEIISNLPIVNAAKYSGGSLDGYAYSQSASPIAITSPNGGDTYYQNGRISITWDYSSFNLVQIDASTDNGSSWFNIGVPVQGVTGIVNWNPTISHISNQCRVRVVDVNNPQVRDSSDAVFSIIATPTLANVKYEGGSFDGYAKNKNLQILSPNGGEVYNVGSRISLGWNYNSQNLVTIEVSTDNGSNWTILANNISGNQWAYNWVPTLSHVSTTCLFRVTDNINPSIFDVSDAVFEIQPALNPVIAKYSGGTLDGYSLASSSGVITLTYPNGAEVFHNGDRVSIRWDYSNSQNVQLDYSTNNGSTWVSIGTTPGNNGIFNWNVPNINSTQMLVRVFNTTLTNDRDSSDATFTVLPARTISNAKFSGGGYDGYVSHSNLSPDPIRYSGGGFDGYSSGSNRPIMTLFNPVGGEQWYEGSVQNITWNYVSVNNIQVQISVNGGSSYTTIATVPAMNGNLSYTVPATPSNICLVRITDVVTGLRDSSAAFFEILPLPVVDANKYQGGSFDGYAMRSSISPVTVITPNGGDNLFVGTQYTIIWSYNSQNNVRIEFSSDGGSSYSTIVASVPAQQRMFNWLVPGTLSNTCRIRVRDVLSSGIFDISDANFSIINLPIVNNDKYSGGSLDGYADADACVSPIATLSGGANLCLGNSTVLTITQSGSMPYAFTYSDGTAQSTISGINFTPFFLVLTPSQTATYSLVSVSNCLGAGTVNGSAVVQVSPAPLASLSGSANICTGGNTNISVQLIGLAPWNFAYTDGTSQFTVTGATASPFLISVTPTVNTNYNLISVATSCGVGTVSGTAAITINPPPTAGLAGSNTICNGGSAMLPVNFTGGGPWDLTWTNGTTPITTSGITSNPFFISISPTATTTYSATGLSTTCLGSASGSAVITVNPVPVITLSGNQVICPGNQATLTFSLTGQAPWNLTYNDGTSNFSASGITASPYFVSVSPNTNRTYTLVSYSDQLCAGVQTGSQAVVQVNTPPVASITGTQSVCTGNAAILTVNLSGPSPWDITWTDGTTPSTVTGITQSPYALSVTPSVNSTYSLTQVSSNCIGTVSGSAALTLVGIPTATLSGNQTICPGSSAQLTMALTGGGPWSVAYTDGNVSTQLTGITSTPYVFQVTPSGISTYTLTNVTASCAGTVSGSAQIFNYTQPLAAISGTQTICQGGSAQLSFILAGVQPWTITYTNGTTPVTQTGITSSPYSVIVTPSAHTTYSVASIQDNFCIGGGGSGTAVISVDPIPTASISGAGTVCAGSPVPMTVQLTGVSPWNITYTDGTNPVSIPGISSSPFVLQVSATSTRTYTLTQVLGSCVGTVSGQGVLTVTPSPTAQMTGTATVCPGNPTQLSINFTSIAPWAVAYTDGTVTTNITGINTNPYVFSVTPSNTRTYTLNSVQNNLCTGVGTGAPIVTVSPAPSAVTSGNTQICSGNSASVSVAFTGAGPWDIIWTDGTTPVPVNGITSNPYIISVSPVASTTYSVISVISGCTGTVSGNAIVQVSTPPSATLSGGTVICTGGSTALSVQFTGAGPWQYSYTDGTIQTNVTGISSSPNVFIVSPGSTRTYSLLSMSGLCTGTISGNAIVTVNNQLPNAVLSGNNTICTLNPTTLSFNMTGNSPWNLVYTDGVVPYSVSGITSSPFLVVVSPNQNTTYSLLNINNVCGNGIVFGTAQIQTSTGPSAIMTGGTSICSGGQSTLSVTLNGPSPWNFTWTDGTTATTVSGITASPYLIQVSPLSNVTYTALSVTGACTGTASGTVALTVLSPPVATLTGTQTICSGQNALLTVSLSGAGPFDLTWTDGTNPVTVPGITASTHIIQVAPQQNRQYQLVAVNGACVGSVSGVANVTVLPSPTVQLSAPSNFCAGASVNLTYTLTGTQPWTIIYNDGVTPVTIGGITSTPYILSVSPVGNTLYTVSDLADAICVISNPGAQVSLTELSAPSAVLSGSGTVCAGSPFNASVQLSGAFPWNFSYTDGTNVITLTGISNSPYQLVVSASAATTFTGVSLSGGGCSGSVTGQVPLGIFPSPSATIAGNATVCPGNGTGLSVALTGSAPWNIVYTDGSSSFPVNGITSTNYVFQVSPVSNRTYSLISVQDGLCSGIVGGSAVVQVSAPPVAGISGNIAVCAGNTAAIPVNLSGVGPWSITWTDGTNTLNQTGITSSPYQIQTTPLSNTTYSLSSVIAGCPGTVSGVATVQVSNPPTAGLSGGAAICTGGNTALSFSLTGQAPWNVTYTDGTIQTTLNNLQSSPFLLSVSPSQTTTYSLVSVSGLCAGTVSGSAIVVVNNLLPNAVLSGTQSICTGNQAQLTIHLSGNAPWSVIYTDGVVPFAVTGISNSPYVFQVSPQNATTYNILNVNNACGNGVVFGNAVINPTITPVATLSGSSTICPGGLAQLSIQMTGSGPYNITWTDGVTPVTVTGVSSNPYIIQVSPSIQTTYQLSAFSNQCTGNFSGTGIVSVLTGGPTATINGTQTVCNGQQAQMSVTLTGTPPWSFVFNDGINPTTVNSIVISPYVFAVSPVFNTTYSMVSVTDANCIGNAIPTPAVVSLTAPPIAGISGSHTICSGGTATLTAVLTGVAPWSLSYTDGVTPVTVTGITASPYLIQVTPSVSSTYMLTQVIGRCTGTTSGQASVQVNVGGPQANLGSSQTICAGTGTSVVMQLIGQAPWNLTWTDGTNNTVVTGINTSPYVISVTPLSTTSYSLTQISDALCTGTLPLTGTNITVIPQPLAVITGTQSICLGSQATFSVSLSGGGPWNVTWTDGTNPISVSGITATPYIFNAIPTINSTYSLLSVSNQCPGNVSGAAVVSVLPPLSATISGSNTVCPGNGANLSVSFAGSGPWNLTWTDGTSPTVVTGITQNPFVFVHSPSISSTYSLLNVSNPSCSGTVLGSGTIVVLQVPTASLSGSQTVCQGVTTSIPVTLTGSFPITLRYSNGVTNTTITGINTTPYLIQVTPGATRTYTINALNNQCPGTFTGSAVIVVNGSPSASIGGAQGVCVGNQALINVSLTGSMPWFFNYTDGTITTTVTGITSSPYQLSVTPFTNTAYTITQVSDQFCTSNGNFGTSLVSIVTAPSATVTGPGTVCAGNSAPINFFLTGASPWDIQYTDGTSTFTVTGISTSPYVLNASPSNSTQYILTAITDQNCVSTGLTASHIVNVTQGPSGTLSGSQQICSGQQATLTFTLTGTAPWSVTYLQGAQVVTVPGIVNPVFTLNVNPGTTTVYTLQSVADALCTGSVSGSATVTVVSPPTAGITGSTSVCSGGSVNLSINLTGTAPWSFNWSDGVNTNVVNNVAASPYVLSVTPNATTFYTITSVSSGACSGTATGNAVVTVGAPPVGSLGTGTAICVGQTAVLPLTLSGIGPWSVSYSDGITTTTVTGITTGTYGLQVNPLATTTYTLLSVTDGSCPGSVGTATAVVSVSLNVPTVSMAGSAAVCVGNLANLVFNFTGSSPWTVSYSDGLNTQTITGILTSPYIHNVAPIVSTTYTPVSVSNACGSGSVAGTATIDVSTQAPTSVFTYSISGYQVNLNNGSVGGSLYLWNFGDGNTSTAYNTSHTYNGPGFYTISLTVTNACGTFTSSQTIFINYGVSVDADRLDKAIEVYPNPSNGKFTVGVKGISGNDLQIRILSAEGKAVADEKHFNISDDMSIPIDISREAAGVYVLKVITGEGIEMYRKITVIRE